MSQDTPDFNKNSYFHEMNGNLCAPGAPCKKNWGDALCREPSLLERRRFPSLLEHWHFMRVKALPSAAGEN